MSSKIKVENQIYNKVNRIHNGLEYSLDDQNTFDDTLKTDPLKSVLPNNIISNLPG
jgi:hypothetical protein